MAGPPAAVTENLKQGVNEQNRTACQFSQFQCSVFAKFLLTSFLVGDIILLIVIGSTICETQRAWTESMSFARP